MKKYQYYERKETYSVDQVLPFVVFGPKFTRRDKNSPENLLKNYDGDFINMSSLRYQLFATKGCQCVSCGVIGTYFAKEKITQDKSYHFNLYGINDKGTEVMLTKDHIFPKSKGGPDTLDNFQTMCHPCNQAKKDSVTGEG